MSLIINDDRRTAMEVLGVIVSLRLCYVCNLSVTTLSDDQAPKIIDGPDAHS